MDEPTMFQRLIVFSTLAALLFTGCNYNRFGEFQLPDNELIVGNIDIATLREFHGGDGVKNVTGDFIIAGVVTANDVSDNFYRTFMLQDLTGAIEIRAGIFDLHTIFVRDRQMAIKLKNLAIGAYNGVLQVGRPPEDGDNSVAFIANRYLPGGYFWPRDNWTKIAPQEVKIADLNDNLCGKLVKINALQSIDIEGNTWNGDRIFLENGDIYSTIIVSTSEYANFADEIIPGGLISLTGILSKKSDTYILKIRDLQDIGLN